MKSTKSISVIGGGSWATALVKILCDNGNDVYWWMRDREAVAYVRNFRHNPRYLGSAELKIRPENVSDDLNFVLGKGDMLLFAIPSAFLKSSMAHADETAIKNKVIISAIKGIVPEDNLLIAEYFHKYYSVPMEKMVVISGPCHAEEVALEKKSYLTISSAAESNAVELSEMLANRYIRTSVTDDIYGTEYGAVLKNIYAIASGICHGLGYGDNFQAVLISNAIREMKRFVDIVHPIDRDIKESAYLGDLLVTAYSQFSRNRTFGTMIGKGYSVKSAQFEMGMIAEGYYAVKCIHEINRNHKAHIPICRTVYGILYENISPSVEMKLLSEILS